MHFSKRSGALLLVLGIGVIGCNQSSDAPPVKSSRGYSDTPAVASNDTSKPADVSPKPAESESDEVVLGLSGMT